MFVRVSEIPPRLPNALSVRYHPSACHSKQGNLHPNCLRDVAGRGGGGLQNGLNHCATSWENIQSFFISFYPNPVQCSKTITPQWISCRISSVNSTAEAVAPNLTGYFSVCFTQTAFQLRRLTAEGWCLVLILDHVTQFQRSLQRYKWSPTFFLTSSCWC